MLILYQSVFVVISWESQEQQLIYIRNDMFNNAILEQFLALQGKSSELTGNMRSISIDTGKEAMEINRNAAQVLHSMGEEYLKKFTGAYDPVRTPAMFGALEFTKMMECWTNYQASLNKVLNRGGQELLNEMGGLSSQACCDFENIVHGFTNNGPMAGTPLMAGINAGLDMLMNSYEQAASLTKNAVLNVERLSDAKV